MEKSSVDSRGRSTYRYRVREMRNRLRDCEGSGERLGFLENESELVREMKRPSERVNE